MSEGQTTNKKPALDVLLWALPVGSGREADSGGVSF